MRHRDVQCYRVWPQTATRSGLCALDRVLKEGLRPIDARVLQVLSRTPVRGLPGRGVLPNAPAPRIVAERHPQHSKEFRQLYSAHSRKTARLHWRRRAREIPRRSCVHGTHLQLYAVSLYSSIAPLAPIVARGSGTKTIPRCRSCTSVQTPAHSLHNQYRSTWRALGRVVGEGATVPSPGLATLSVSTRKSLPWRRRRKGLEHCEFAQWLSTNSSAGPLLNLNLSSAALLS